MRNVAQISNFIGLACALALTACTKTPVDVSSLGMKLSAPQLKSTSPFDQDMDAQGYAEFSGTCSGFVSSIGLSMNGNDWYDVPSQTTYTVAGATNTYNNDTDCSDGKFSFYITKDMINTWVGHVVADGEITTLFLRGDGYLGETENLVLVDSKGNGNNGGTPTALHIQNNFPRNFGLLGACTEMQISLRSSSGETSTSTDTPFTITEIPGGLVNLYSEMSACQAGIAGTSTSASTILANNSNARVYVKLPSSGTRVTYQVGTTANLTTNSQAITLRDSTYKWVGLDQSFNRFYKNICYPVNLYAYNYDGSSWGTHTPSINVTPVASDSHLQFSSLSDCSDNPASFTIPSYGASATIYAKYVDTVTTTGMAPVTVSLTAVAAGFNVDGAEADFSVDLNSNADSFTRLGFQGPNRLSSGFCSVYKIGLLNQNWASLKNSSGSAIGVSLSSTFTSQGSFYGNSTDCNSGTGAITTTSIADNEFYATVYFKSLVPVLTMGTLKAQSSGLADGTETVTAQPAPFKILASVQMLPSDYQKVFGGYSNTCVLDGGQRLFCSGHNSSNQLLNGTGVDSPVFVQVDPGTQYWTIAIGNGHICGITAANTLRCWGANSFGQIGNGTTTTTEPPQDIQNDVAFVTAGPDYTCSIDVTGKARCWGDNVYGQLGDGTTTFRSTPTNVAGVDQYVSLSSGQTHTCGATITGNVKCWGDNSNGALGIGTSSGTYTTPQTLATIADAVSVSANYQFSCAVDASGNVMCWGKNSSGQVGVGTSTGYYTTPQVVDSGVTYIKVVTGLSHTCGLKNGGEITCWGNNGAGQIGDGTATNRLSPVSPATSGTTNSNFNFNDLSAGQMANCAINSSHNLVCWGENDYGLFGDDSAVNVVHSLAAENACYQLTLEVKDALGAGIATPSLLSVYVSDWNSNFYGNSSCTGNAGTQIQFANVDIQANAMAGFAYMRKWTASPNLNFSNGSGLQLPLSLSY